ncbi:tripartite tricarboxylate transporter TctB family protein [Microbaculum marinisediminis]|uniref:Tripartite tricarboxylate transporter TctB family protein n=1 Tax=Microbaculum marinisediminis TaxID=2931392 RepID=A0AAW5QRN7_9HYPH|nr:tripartite tricarboxylate transporter TctB family protein [Microbaculum sp. A6E488]MCT8970532.1 tripartite tricarboxylate transporter TctB family protein [Microbaculum sp. A6E488]
MSDRILGAAGLAVAIFYIWSATLIELSFISDPVGPRTFPIIIGVLLGLASIVILLRPDAEPHWPSIGRFAEIAGAVVVMVAYALLLPVAGFVIATAGASAVLTWRLGTAPLYAVIAGILTSLGIYAVFHLVLGLTLARGPLGF